MTDKDYFETKQHVQRNRIQAVDVAILIAMLTLKDKDNPINHPTLAYETRALW